MSTIYKKSNRRWLRPKSGGTWGIGTESFISWSVNADLWKSNNKLKKSKIVQRELNGSLHLQDCDRKANFDLTSYNKRDYEKQDTMLQCMIEEIEKVRKELEYGAIKLGWIGGFE